MATKPTQNKPKQDTWEAKGFVNLHLTEKQLEHCWFWAEGEEKVLKAFYDEMANDYRFTFSQDNKTGSVICTVNCKDKTSTNYGWLLSSFGPDHMAALTISLYKHLVVLEAKWSDMETRVPASKYG